MPLYLNVKRKAPSLDVHDSWELNLSNFTLKWSKKLYEIFGLLPTETYENHFDFIHPEDIEMVRETLLNATKPYEMKYRIIRKDGSYGIVKEYGEPYVNEITKQITSIIGVTQDITNQIESEGSTWKSQFNLSQAQKIFGFVNWEADLKTKTLEWSDGVVELLGIKPTHIDEFVTLIHPNDIEFVAKSGKEAFEGNPYNIEYRIIRPDGVIKVIHEQAQVIYDSAFNPSRMFGTILDITERKKTEEFLLNSDKLSLVGQLAAGIAHEIRNPLTSLKGFIQMVESGERKPEYFDIMKEEINRIDFIVGEFLSIAKPKSITYEDKDIIQILHKTTSFLEAQCNLKNVNVEKKFSNCQVHVFCFENQIKQLFVNIIKNAIEAMPNGGTLSVQTEIKHQKYLYIRFIDTGVGIPPETLKRLGEPFYSTKEKGNGLGIMVCQKIIKEHAGQLLIDSEQGKGTTITIVLPISHVQQ